MIIEAIIEDDDDEDEANMLLVKTNNGDYCKVKKENIIKQDGKKVKFDDQYIEINNDDIRLVFGPDDPNNTSN